MVTTYIQGGLGNQMFQIVAALSHAKRNKDVCVFNLNESHTPHQGVNVSKYKDKLFKFNHDENVYTTCSNVFSQPGHGHCEIPYVENQQLQGFFQSEKFFIDDKKEVCEMFINNLKSSYPDRWELINSELGSLREHCGLPVVSIHIRRGDYLKFPQIHTPCTVGYYNRSMGVIKKIVGDFRPYFISDDIEWCRRTFNGVGEFSNYVDEIDDLILMVNCDHNIIANSSFSWWGAYLNDRPNKIVVGPKIWFGSDGPRDQEDTLPKEWVKI